MGHAHRSRRSDDIPARRAPGAASGQARQHGRKPSTRLAARGTQAPFGLTACLLSTQASCGQKETPLVHLSLFRTHVLFSFFRHSSPQVTPSSHPSSTKLNNMKFSLAPLALVALAGVALAQEPASSSSASGAMSTGSSTSSSAASSSSSSSAAPAATSAAGGDNDNGGSNCALLPGYDEGKPLMTQYGCTKNASTSTPVYDSTKLQVSAARAMLYLIHRVLTNECSQSLRLSFLLRSRTSSAHTLVKRRERPQSRLLRISPSPSSTSTQL